MSAPQQPEHTANERDLRLAKREELMKQGVNPYPPFFDRTHYIKAILDNAAALEEAKQEVKVCGKVYATRTHGGSLFLDIADQSGKIQIYAKLDVLQEKQFNLIRDFVGTGDYIGVHGTVFHTKKGQLSILIDSFEILSKALRSLPGKWYGFKDTEKRYRQRYIDVLLNADVKERFIKRASIIDAIRDTLKKKDFLEVDTPTLHPIYGGAHAKPFTTYYESLKRDFYLRISNELYLKRAIIGNFEKVFEFSRDFRNEGIDATHNPEFTMIEIYEAYKDYQYCMQMTKMLILEANKKIGNGMQLEWGEQKIDLSGDWEQISMSELLKKHTGMDVINSSREQLFEYAKSIGLKLPPHTVWGTLVDKIFSEKVEPQLVNPTFVVDYPLDISPLAKQHRDNDKLVERFELYIGTKEIANGFSELNDPVEQRKRFEGQNENKEAGDEEAHPLDEDFLLAQEYGMPPTTGVGIGIDRLVMLLTNATTIREVVMFPQLKGEE